MLQHIIITTDIDITNTGVVRSYKEGSLPSTISNRVISTKEQWIQCRRQQSNWETFIQVISLRAQPLNLRTVIKDNEWMIEFDIEHIDVFKIGYDKLAQLKSDFALVPVLTGLREHTELDQFIIVDGTKQNIRFETYEL